MVTMRTRIACFHSCLAVSHDMHASGRAVIRLTASLGVPPKKETFALESGAFATKTAPVSYEKGRSSRRMSRRIEAVASTTSFELAPVACKYL